jgi:hypothetical protein
MTNTTTPGEKAYAAYFQALYETTPTSSDVWTWQTPAVQHAWEAAAQAVLAMQQEEEQRDATS